VPTKPPFQKVDVPKRLTQAIDYNAPGYVPRNHDEAIVGAVLRNMVNKVVVEEEFRQQMEAITSGAIQPRNEYEGDALRPLEVDDDSSDEAKEAIQAAIANGHIDEYGRAVEPNALVDVRRSTPPRMSMFGCHAIGCGAEGSGRLARRPPAAG